MDALTPIRMLVIEDCEDDVTLLVHAIRKGEFDPMFIHVDNKEDLSQALGVQSWDIIFSDYTMPSFNGREALKIVRMHDPDVPFFFVSGTIGEDRAVEAMRLGAQDYFIKGNLTRLPSAIERELRDSVRRRNHRLAEERIFHLANYDSLTGLANRTLFTERLTQAMAAASEPVGIFSLNLKRFKDVNDHLGAAAGDTLLIEVAKRLVVLEGLFNTVARFSGDEFAILVTDLKGEADVSNFAEQLQQIFVQPFLLSRYEWRMHASLGASIFPRHGSHYGELIDNAAIALHHAQQAGTDDSFNFAMYDAKMRSVLQEKITLQHALELALDRNELELHYQPQVSLTDGRIVGVEALLRWQRPGVGPVSPATFIPAAESSGLIVPIGEQALRSACRQIRLWQEQGVAPLRVAVNVSAYQFRQRHLLERVRSCLAESAVDPEHLEVEITETALMQDPDIAQTILFGLRDIGVSIALDDFGTGYSSLGHLKRFPVTLLKIDRGFIEDLPHDQDDAAIVHAIIAMAKSLKMNVIAEGVETVEQMVSLKEAGCDMVQGYYFERPQPAEQLLPILLKGKLPV